MFLVKTLLGIPSHDATRHGRVCGLSGGQRRPRPLLLERLEDRLCLSKWSEPINLGPMVNSSSDDKMPALSPDGLSLYITTNRPGGIAGHAYDILVSERA